MIDLSNYNVYESKDGRLRAYNKTTHKVTSYPRVVMEAILGRPLLPTEDVHHKDENPRNNDPNNLEVIDHREHEKQHAADKKASGKLKYYDIQMTCPICNKLFAWTAKQQTSYHHKTRVTENTRKYDRQPPCCSKQCAGKLASSVQYGITPQTEKVEPKERICPICGKKFMWSKSSQYAYRRGEVALPEPCCSLSCMHALRKRIKQQQ